MTSAAGRRGSVRGLWRRCRRAGTLRRPRRRVEVDDLAEDAVVVSADPRSKSSHTGLAAGTASAATRSTRSSWRSRRKSGRSRFHCCRRWRASRAACLRSPPLKSQRIRPRAGAAATRSASRWLPDPTGRIADHSHGLRGLVEASGTEQPSPRYSRGSPGQGRCGGWCRFAQRPRPPAARRRTLGSPSEDQPKVPGEQNRGQRR